MLCGGSTGASLMPAAPLGLQSKPKAKRAWHRASFKSMPEEKQLVLTHWAPVGQPHDPHAFRRFDKSVNILRYTDAEYNAVIANLHPLNVDEAAIAALKKRTPARVKAAAQKATKNTKAAASANKNTKEAATVKDKASQIAVPVAAGMNALPAPIPALAGILSPQKAPSAAPKSSVAAGTRKSILASPKALAAAAAIAAATAPAPKPPKSPKPPPVQAAAQASSSGQPLSLESLREVLNYVLPQKPWTREETDALFDLCDRFDLRFAVIHDRWPDIFPSRTVEELKDRYYSVAKRLIEHRTKTNKDALTSLPLALQKHCQAISMNPFDYEYECVRKNQLEFQYGRSKLELREEEETVREARRIEANRKRTAKERQRLAKLLTPSGDISMTPDGKRGTSLEQALAAAASMPQKTFPHRKVQSGAFARSSMIYTPVSASQRVSKRIDAALRDLDVGVRPTPTSIVVDNFDLLRMDILAAIELQRTVMRKEEDVHTLRVKLAKLKGEELPPPPPGVNLSHKKRKVEDGDLGSLFSGPVQKRKTSES